MKRYYHVQENGEDRGVMDQKNTNRYISERRASLGVDWKDKNAKVLKAGDTEISDTIFTSNTSIIIGDLRDDKVAVRTLEEAIEKDISSGRSIVFLNDTGRDIEHHLKGIIAKKGMYIFRPTSYINPLSYIEEAKGLETFGEIARRNKRLEEAMIRALILEAVRHLRELGAVKMPDTIKDWFLSGLWDIRDAVHKALDENEYAFSDEGLNENPKERIIAEIEKRLPSLKGSFVNGVVSWKEHDKPTNKRDISRWERIAEEFWDGVLFNITTAYYFLPHDLCMTRDSYSYEKEDPLVIFDRQGIVCKGEDAFGLTFELLYDEIIRRKENNTPCVPTHFYIPFDSFRLRVPNYEAFLCTARSYGIYITLLASEYIKAARPMRRVGFIEEPTLFSGYGNAPGDIANLVDSIVVCGVDDPDDAKYLSGRTGYALVTVALPVRGGGIFSGKTGETKTIREPLISPIEIESVKERNEIIVIGGNR